MKAPVTLFVTTPLFLLTLSPTTLAATHSTMMVNIPTIIFLATTLPTTTFGIKINEIHRPIILESSKPNLSQRPRPRYPDGHMPHIFSIIVISIIVIIIATIVVMTVTVIVF